MRGQGLGYLIGHHVAACHVTERETAGSVMDRVASRNLPVYAATRARYAPSARGQGAPLGSAATTWVDQHCGSVGCPRVFPSGWACPHHARASWRARREKREGWMGRPLRVLAVTIATFVTTELVFRLSRRFAGRGHKAA